MGLKIFAGGAMMARVTSGGIEMGGGSGGALGMAAM